MKHLNPFCLSLLALFFLTAMPSAVAFEARLGKTSEPLNIDGEVAPGEYASGLELWGLLSKSTGEVSRRTATLYLARDDEGLALAVVSGIHDRIGADSRDAVRLTITSPSNETISAMIDGEGRLSAPPDAIGTVRTEGGKWTTELYLPWSTLGGEPMVEQVWNLQVTRRWHDPDETTTLADGGASVVMDDDAPGVVVRLGSTPPIDGAGPQFQWQVTAPKAHGCRVRCEARVQWLGNPESVDATQDIPAGESRMFCLNMTGLPSDPRQMTCTLTDEQGEVLVKREFAWGGKEGLEWDDPHPETVFSLATYPSLKSAKARVSCAKPALLDQVQSVHFVITDPEE
ncbi:MAG: hypothetical protein IKS83_03045, partial [Victivallales bacterium]|nr:hypothetical protein [Victivallales bacterium]